MFIPEHSTTLFPDQKQTNIQKNLKSNLRFSLPEIQVFVVYSQMSKLYYCLKDPSCQAPLQPHGFLLAASLVPPLSPIAISLSTWQLCMWYHLSHPSLLLFIESFEQTSMSERRKDRMHEGWRWVSWLWTTKHLAAQSQTLVPVRCC